MFFPQKFEKNPQVQKEHPYVFSKNFRKKIDNKHKGAFMLKTTAQISKFWRPGVPHVRKHPSTKINQFGAKIKKLIF